MYVTIDSIVKSFLLRKEYPMHWYLVCLKHAADCVRDLRVTSLPYVQTTMVTVNEYGAFDLPEDFESLIRIGYMNGQYVVPLVQGKGTMNRMVLRNSSGAPVPYDQTQSRGYYSNYWMANWFGSNMFGETAGGYFGYGAGYETDLFEVIPERNQVQVSQELAALTLVFDYMGDINHPNNLTQIPAVAQACIEQYIAWQLKEHGRHYSKGEAKDDERMFKKQRDILRAQIDPLSKEDILRIFRRGYHGANKA